MKLMYVDHAGQRVRVIAGLSANEDITTMLSILAEVSTFEDDLYGFYV